MISQSMQGWLEMKASLFFPQVHPSCFVVLLESASQGSETRGKGFVLHWVWEAETHPYTEETAQEGEVRAQTTE